jgi:hypothetical protein
MTTKKHQEFRDSKLSEEMEFELGEYKGFFRRFDADGNVVEERPITDADIDRSGIRGSVFWQSLTEGFPDETA